MYHPHFKSPQAELIAGALASMAYKFPEMEAACRDALSGFNSNYLEAKFENHIQALRSAKFSLTEANKITWTCHICGKERPDKAISVHKRDVSEDFGSPVGTVYENVRYCNDDKTCIEQSTVYRHLKRYA